MFFTLCLSDEKLEAMFRFYTKLGCDLKPERHGERGLWHYSAVLEAVPFELYPALRTLPEGEKIFIGFEVDSPEKLKDELIEQFSGVELIPPVAVTKSGIATLRDPCGVLIRLFPKTTVTA